MKDLHFFKILLSLKQEMVINYTNWIIYIKNRYSYQVGSIMKCYCLLQKG